MPGSGIAMPDLGEMAASPHAVAEHDTRRLVLVMSLLFLMAGIALSVLYPSVNRAPGESGQAALALLHAGYIGDPYMLPTGPTAHVSPPLAAMSAVIFWLFGDNSQAARIVLGLVATLMYVLSVRATLRICALRGTDGRSVWIASGLLILCPMFLYESVVSSRQWDQPFAAFILVQGWLTFENTRRSARLYRGEAAMALAAGLGGLVSPAILPSLTLALCWLIWLRRRRGDVRISIIIAAIIIAASLLPWGIRNKIELGDFIITRSNFALEMAVGNAPGALGYSGSGSGVVFHPHDSIDAAREVQKLGEVAYMHKLRDMVIGWIRADPRRFMELSLVRLRLAFVPSAEMVGWYPGFGRLISWLILAAMGIIHLISLAAAFVLWMRRTSTILWQGLIFTVLPLAPYVITHVNIRYEMAVFFTTVVLAASVLGKMRSVGPVPNPYAALRPG
jgi:hypothetical protein